MLKIFYFKENSYKSLCSNILGFNVVCVSIHKILKEISQKCQIFSPEYPDV